MFGHVDSPLKPYNFMFNPKKLVIANGRSRVRIQLISKKILSLIQYEMFFWKKWREWTLAELGIPKKKGSNPPYAAKQWSNNSYKADALIVGQSSP